MMEREREEERDPSAEINIETEAIDGLLKESKIENARARARRSIGTKKVLRTANCEYRARLKSGPKVA